MLSAESAVGKHPLEAIRWLGKIAEDADDNQKVQLGRFVDHLADEHRGTVDVAVAFAACYTAVEIQAKWIVVFTEGGGSARMVSRLASGIPVLGLTTSLSNARRMGLLRGVTSLLVQKTVHMSEMVAQVGPLLRKEFGIEFGDRVVMTLGHPLWTTGTTNTLRVLTF
jgi:pyruvate kinase